MSIRVESNVHVIVIPYLKLFCLFLWAIVNNITINFLSISLEILNKYLPNPPTSVTGPKVWLRKDKSNGKGEARWALCPVIKYTEFGKKNLIKYKINYTGFY